MKILMVYEVYRPVEGGVQTWISEVIPRLLKNHKVTLLTTRLDGVMSNEHEKFDVHRLGVKGSFSSLLWKGYFTLLRCLWVALAARWIREHVSEYDLVYAHVQASELASVLGAYPLRPVVWHYHGTNHEVLYDLFSTKKAILYELFEHLGARLPFDSCVTSDEYTRNIMLRHFGTQATRIFTIRNGVDVNKFYPTDDLPTKGLIFCARRLVYKNGLQYLIPAMRQVIQQHPTAALWIAGDGPMRSYLEQLVKRLGLSKKVRFLGQVPNRDLPKLYSKAEVVVLPSMIEATSISCLEAMACGRPVLATAVGGVPEIISPGTGFLITFHPNESFINELGDKLSFILSNSELARSVGKAARQRVVSEFTWDITARSVDALLCRFSGHYVDA